MPAPYRLRLQQAFDDWSSFYDTSIAGNTLASRLRQISLEVLLSSFTGGQRLLEIGCGTGAEAVQLAKKGLRILATDISQKMLSHLGLKVAKLGLTDRIQTKNVAAGQLADLVTEFGEESFDGGYSSFGALNCEPDLRPVFSAAAKLIKPYGLLVCSLRNRFCLAQTLLSLLTFRPGGVASRMRRPTTVSIAGHATTVYPFAPWELHSSYANIFDLVSLLGLPVILPPQEYDSAFRNTGWVTDFLDSLDRKVSRVFPLNLFGDYFLVKLKRKAAEARPL